MISRKALLGFALSHADAAAPLDAWFRIAKASHWSSLTQIRLVYPAADVVGHYTIFNIKGNAYRLITRINYQSRVILSAASTLTQNMTRVIGNDGYARRESLRGPVA